ncbi:DUF2071 domain-containing protein [Pontibacter sp. G13]|uniref:YqjF family protein n=1 Tax=Pontibacter sp. G13 TaxID=3074898 RepID=UPI0028895CAF|nr:DUF2071 domain-containing protein [Pontibacter sp. G13]WNJ18660.1 DUF2071 domain-containing protein [Pontibacter sp. G13]
MASTNFLTAEWNDLLLANYAVDPAILQPHVPIGTELDLYEGVAYVSLVAFRFEDTRLLGIPIPFHINFEEVNLRFYVKAFQDGEWKRGVVFVKEIVPKPAIAWVANVVYREPYVTRRMDHKLEMSEDHRTIQYRWKEGQEWQEISAVADAQSVPLYSVDPAATFITEHYWGYTKWSDRKTTGYEVVHPSWEVFPIRQYRISVDVAATYGPQWAEAMPSSPDSVFWAQGSEVAVRSGFTLTEGAKSSPV